LPHFDQRGTARLLESNRSLPADRRHHRGADYSTGLRAIGKPTADCFTMAEIARTEPCGRIFEQPGPEDYPANVGVTEGGACDPA
jgi:hypothetical protein